MLVNKKYMILIFTRHLINSLVHRKMYYLFELIYTAIVANYIKYCMIMKMLNKMYLFFYPGLKLKYNKLSITNFIF